MGPYQYVCVMPMASFPSTAGAHKVNAPMLEAKGTWRGRGVGRFDRAQVDKPVTGTRTQLTLSRCDCTSSLSRSSSGAIAS